MNGDQRYRWEQRVRGLMLGLALGEAIGGLRGEVAQCERLWAGVATQLAAFTAEGLIRADVRRRLHGSCNRNWVLWHAYSRWAALQHIATAASAYWGSKSAGEWPDGWLAHIPELAENRGPSAATILALQQDRPGTPERPVTNNAGCHALIRTLPAAALATTRSRDQLKREAEACAALTHGAPAAQQATATAVLFAAECLSGRDPTDALSRTGQLAEGGQLDQVRDEAEHAPADRNRLARIAPDASAEAALAGAVYCVLSHPGPGSEVTALQLASTAPHPAPVAAITGAILGAAHGVHAWPVELVSRLDLAWPLDTLARDLLKQLTNDPEVSDPGWWERYPGW